MQSTKQKSIHMCMHKSIMSILRAFFITIVIFSIQNVYAENTVVGKCSDINDPYETLNRKIFAFNKTLDYTVLRPATLLYINTVPEWPRSRVHSFFSNLMSPLTLVNNILQGDFTEAGQTFGRFLFNSTAGIGGLLDWSKLCGVENKPQIFEDTLMNFGVPYGQYVVLPFLGQSTTRGTIGKVVDVFTDPVNLILIEHKHNLSIKYFLAKKFDQRVEFEENLDLSKQNLLDEYSFIRSSYLQYVAHQNPSCNNNQEIDYELSD